MILYEYQCLNCKAKFQKTTHLENHRKISCPGCGGKKVKKLWATIFKLNNSCKKSCTSCGNCK